MLEDFKRALARVQTDYGFYIGCQTNSAAALAGYDLSSDERSALIDPEKLTDIFKRGVGFTKAAITITISGTHDWVNRAQTPRPKDTESNVEGRIATEVDAIRGATTQHSRTDAVVRLMELIG